MASWSRGMKDKDNRMAEIKRGFIDVAEGQIHYRTAGVDAKDRVPLVMIHGEPASSYVLAPLISRLGDGRRVIAPDTLGTGDSSPLPWPKVEVTDLARVAAAAITALGVDRFDLYGNYTGGHIATELALAHPGRVRRLVLDDSGLIPEADVPDLVANYVPDISIDSHGAHMSRLFAWVRDQYIYFPWYRRDAQHWRNMDMPAPEVLFAKTMEVLKGKNSMPIIFAAVFRHDLRTALTRLRVPSLTTDEELALVPGAKPLGLKFREAVSAPPGYVDDKAQRIAAFLDAP